MPVSTAEVTAAYSLSAVFKLLPVAGVLRMESKVASHACFAAAWLVQIVNNLFMARFFLYLEAADAHYRYTLFILGALGNNAF
jgi:hypothetical protein